MAVTINGQSVDLDTARAMVSACDIRAELTDGCEAWRITYEGGQAGWMARWPNGRGAYMTGADSEWGNWHGDALILDDGDTAVDTGGDAASLAEAGEIARRVLAGADPGFGWRDAGYDSALGAARVLVGTPGLGQALLYARAAEIVADKLRERGV